MAGMATPAVGGWRLHRRGSSTKRTQRAIDRIRAALLCAFIALLLTLCFTVGVTRRRFVSIAASDARATRDDDVERVLREIRADADDPDDDGAPPASGYYDRGSAWSTANYSLGPRVTRWNARRRRWLLRNPGFPSRDARGRARVLLATSSPPGPCATPAGDRFLLRATKNRLDYCRLHGIEFLHSTARLDAQLTGRWAKLPLLRRLMLAHPEVEWLWWLDGDALVTDMGFELPLERYVGCNLVVHGHYDLLFRRRSWAAVSTASFLLRNCQWSLDLLDAWAVMGPRGRARRDAGRLLTAALEDRPAAAADDQSALVHLLLTERDAWAEKVYIENQYYLYGFWPWIVDGYEELMGQHHPGYGDYRWPFLTSFVGCEPCDDDEDDDWSRLRPATWRPGDEEYSEERCAKGKERAFNFADNQVLRLYGFRHESLASAEVTPVANRSANPLEAKEEAISFLKKPEDPPPTISDVRRAPKCRGEGCSSSLLQRFLKRMGWRS